MEYTVPGRTGLEVSVAGLGCGGSSRLGLAAGKTRAESVAVVHRTLDLGVNFLDTAEAYGTEEIIGEALRGAGRDSAVVATKARVRRGGAARTPAEIAAGVDGSLKRLGVERIDLYMLHAVAPGDYAAARNRLRQRSRVPEFPESLPAPRAAESGG